MGAGAKVLESFSFKFPGILVEIGSGAMGLEQALLNDATVSGGSFIHIVQQGCSHSILE